MNVKVLGVGCANCKNTVKLLETIAHEKGIEIQMEKVEDMEKIMRGERKARGREIAVTFDDGHISFKNDAYPILQKYKFPVTLFVVSEQVESGALDRMNVSMIKDLLQNSWIDVESHTVTHRVLADATDAEIKTELVDSKNKLESLFERPVDYLSYPTGNIDERAPDQAKKAGYRLAFVTSYKKLKNMPEGPYTIPREKISRTSDNPLQFWVKLSGIYRSFKRLRHFTLHPQS